MYARVSETVEQPTTFLKKEESIDIEEMKRNALR